MNSDDEFNETGSLVSSDNEPEELDEEIYGQEFAAFQRAGLNQQLAMPENRLEKGLMDPLQKFTIFVSNIARNIDIVSEEDINFMIDSASKLEYVQYKNPTAYILGFLATQNKKELTKKNLDKVVNNVLPQVQDQSIKIEDIIRYSRLWLRL